MEHLLLILLMAGFFPHSSTARNLTEIRYHFTTCGASGRNGPTPVQRTCAQHYREINSPIQTVFGFGPNTFQGAQGFRLPQAGLYNITVAGASGGRGICNTVFGFGAVQKLQVELSLEHELLTLVGQRGIGPCEVEDLDPELWQLVCEDPPSSFNESEVCQTVWREWLLEVYNGSVSAGLLYGSITGGGSGGGASMVRLIDAENGQFANLPLIVAAGGGGSPAVLAYETDYFADRNTTLSIEEQYLLYLNGKLYYPNAPVPSGVRGRRDEMSTVVSSGAGGGWTRHVSLVDALIDGMPLSEPQNFAQGGSDCAVLGTDPSPFQGVYGGFGGGGGGCGGGGGGGGFMGGSVLVRPIAVEELGGGGLSVYFNNSPLILYDRGSGYNTAMMDGYVDIVLSDCGCVHECVVDEEADQFKCLCPEDARLAPDQSDCFKAIEIEVTEVDLIRVNQDDFYFSNLSLSSQHFIFSLEINLTTAPNQQRRRQVRQSGGSSGDDEELCAVILVGDESVVLVSNVVRGTGMANLLAPVTHNNNTFIISSYIPFLNSPELVRRALLVSTGSCSVVDMKIRTDTSIKEPSESSPDYDLLGMINPEIIHNFASRVLQLQASPSPTATTPPTMNVASTHHVITALVVVVVLLGIILLVVLVAVPVGYRTYQTRRKRQQAVTTNVTIENLELVPVGCASLDLNYVQYKDAKDVHLSESSPLGSASSEHGYVVVSYETEDDPEAIGIVSLEKHIVPRFGISAPAHDFSDYNRNRSASQITSSDWEYPRANLIYLRELGEGQFGKVLLMKAKGIAGFTDRIPVAVKTLSSSDHDVVKKFIEEAELMKQFSHPNIVSLLGISSADEDSAPLMILEYMQYGDLQSFLESYRPKENQNSQITESHFYSFAADVVTAMEFLAANKYVHRDLAARNCLVGSALRIKIADFGLARGVYNKDYYRVAGKAVLPIRWMAPECLIYGMFTTASDVWSFGVLLWEIVTYGQLPLEDLNVQDIIDRAQNGSLEHQRPRNCPDEIFSVMSQCHSCDADRRPTFTDIYTVFIKKRSDTEMSMAV